MSAEETLKKQGILLPKIAPALGSYIPVLRSGNLIYMSGVLSKSPKGEIFTGRGGQDSIERGQQAARLAVLGALAILKDYLGSLDKIERVVRLVGYVQSEDSFKDHPKVLNGASDFLINLFGEEGKHTRSAVGVASLPMGAFVEIELTLEAGSK